MGRKIEANGEKWEVRLSREEPHEGVGVVIFRCTSNSSYGWRVVEIREGEFGTQERLEKLPDAELDALFARSQPFDYTHDPEAHPDSIGDSGAAR